MTMGMRKAIHLTGSDLADMVQLRPQDIGKYAILPGTPDRLDALVKRIDDPMKNFSFLEHRMYTGEYEGIRLTAMNGGMFSANTAITTEIVCAIEAHTIIRLGSCGALSEDIKVGDLVLATGSIRGDGVTPYYVGEDFETLPDPGVTEALEQAAAEVGTKLHKGIVWSTDALLRETRELVEGKADAGAVAVDMVSSTLLTIAQLKKVRAASILAVSDNVMTGEMGFTNPSYYIAQTTMIKVALAAVKILDGKK
ncbi:MAG: phosphorylase family protein, partial [Planctomycetota bacterium]|jgi:uridine phosphorylase